MKTLDHIYDRASELLKEWQAYRSVHYDRRFSANESIDLDLAKTKIDRLARILQEDILVGNDDYIEQDAEKFASYLSEFKDRFIIDILAKPSSR